MKKSQILKLLKEAESSWLTSQEFPSKESTLETFKELTKHWETLSPSTQQELMTQLKPMGWEKRGIVWLHEEDKQRIIY